MPTPDELPSLGSITGSDYVIVHRAGSLYQSPASTFQGEQGVPGAGVSDGNKGQITVSDSGDTWAINSGVILNANIGALAAIAYSKMATVTADRVLVSDGSGVLTPSSITTTELGYLDNVTSNIQTQLDSKYAPGGTDVALADGGTGASLGDPGADSIMFWDESASTVKWLTVGDNLTIVDETLNAEVGVLSDDATRIEVMTQAAYDALAEPDPETLYFLTV